MRLTRRVAVGVALVCGALAAALTIVYLRSMQAQKEGPAKPQTVEVVVPLSDIPARTIITADLLATQTIDIAKAPRAPATDVNQIVGWVTVEALEAQKPITKGQVTPKGSAFGLSGLVPPGLRAVTVEVDPVVGVAGLLKAGDRVDVIATFEVGEEIMARTILQDVLLLALGSTTVATTAQDEKRAASSTATAEDSSAEAPPERARAAAYPNATFAVTPEDAQRLVLADKRGELRLTLRAVGETDFAPVSVQDMAGVGGAEYLRLRALEKPAKDKAEEKSPEPPMAPPWMGAPTGPSPAPTTKPQPKKPEIEIIRGDQTTKVVP